MISASLLIGLASGMAAPRIRALALRGLPVDQILLAELEQVKEMARRAEQHGKTQLAFEINW